MTDPENSPSFHDIVGDLDLRQDGIYELASIEDFKDQMLTRLFERILNLDDFDVASEEAYQRVCEGLSLEMSEEFMKTDGLQFGDEVVSIGEMMYMTMSGSDPAVEPHMLPADFKLRGKAMGFVVASVPDHTLIARDIRQYHIDNPMPMVRFGLGMILCGATVDCGSSRINYDAYGLAICVPLGNGPAPMKRVVT